jgi:hypothetical protein
MDKIVNSYQALGEQQTVLFGRRLGDSSGLSRTKIIDRFGLTNEQVDDIATDLLPKKHANGPIFPTLGWP